MLFFISIFFSFFIVYDFSILIRLRLKFQPFFLWFQWWNFIVDFIRHLPFIFAWGVFMTQQGNVFRKGLFLLQFLLSCLLHGLSSLWVVRLEVVVVISFTNVLDTFLKVLIFRGGLCGLSLGFFSTLCLGLSLFLTIHVLFLIVNCYVLIIDALTLYLGIVWPFIKHNLSSVLIKSDGCDEILTFFWQINRDGFELHTLVGFRGRLCVVKFIISIFILASFLIWVGLITVSQRLWEPADNWIFQLHIILKLHDHSVCPHTRCEGNGHRVSIFSRVFAIVDLVSWENRSVQVLFNFVDTAPWW